MKWFEVLNEVRQAKGKQKLEILKENKECPVLEDVLYFLYSPRVVTGISKKKMAAVDEAYEIKFKDEEERVTLLMQHLSENNTGKFSDVSTAISIIESTDNMLEREMLESLVVKDTPFGISAGTINKVFENLIPVFKLQKGQLFEGDFNGVQAVSLKLDGNSATVFNLQNETYMLSRSGAIMEGFDHILDVYRNTMPLEMVYQGELIAKNFDNLEHGPLFQLSNGITNSKYEKEGFEKERLQHVIFDAIPYDHFQKGKSPYTYAARIELLEELDWLDVYDPYDDTYDDVLLIPFYAWTDDENIIMEHADKVMKDGLEGLMICEASSTYKVGKQKWLQKIKEFKTADVFVTGIKEHVRGGKVGSLIVDWKGNELAVGGLKDSDRQLWWDNQNEIVGKLIEIKYFRETQNKEGKLSVRFPAFIRIRDDKFEESYE